MSKKINIFWFRRDLRLDDNIGFYNALKSEHPVLPIFIFDSEIVDKLSKDDARLTFIHQTLQDIRETLQDEYNSSIALHHGKPKDIYKQLIKDYTVDTVYTNHDYEPYATERDTEIKSFLVGLYSIPALRPFLTNSLSVSPEELTLKIVSPENV